MLVSYDDLLMLICTIFDSQLKAKGARTKSSFRATPLVERGGGAARAGLKCHTVGFEPPLPHFFNNDELFQNVEDLFLNCEEYASSRGVAGNPSVNIWTSIGERVHCTQANQSLTTEKEI